MHITKNILLISGLAALGYAQDSNSSTCDPQNDDTSCTSSVAANTASSASSLVTGSSVIVNTNTVTSVNTNTLVPLVTPTTSSDSLATRMSLVTNVDTNIILYTSVNTYIDTTSLPHSLDTRSRTILSTIVLSSIRVFTTNTLSDGRLTTSTATVAAPSASTTSDDSDTSQTSDAAGAAASSSTASSMTSSALGCMQTAGLFIPAGVAMAAIGLAAGL